MDAPQLHAVIEVPVDVPELVCDVPERPWPAFVRLHDGTPQQHIALVIGCLAQYPQRNHPLRDLASLCRDFPRMAPGGLVASHQEVEIFPSCCCGLEGWREWERLLTDGRQPWLGHDPSPWIEVHDQEFTVWSEGGSDGDVRGAICVKFSPEELKTALAAVERDLGAFLGPLRRWAGLYDGQSADSLAAAFATSFLARPAERSHGHWVSRQLARLARLARVRPRE